jgi:hypothetical protein
MKPKKPKALVITVNYRDENGTLNLVASLQRAEGLEQICCIVADNTSSDERVCQLRVRLR